MAQNLNFSKTVQELYFSIDVKNLSVDSVISKFMQTPGLHHVEKAMYSKSLTLNLDMETDNEVKKITHIFQFNKSPLPKICIDSGYIKIGVGEEKSTKKIIEIDWCLQFYNKSDAEFCFEELKRVFTPLSTKTRFSDQELNSERYAEFSICDVNETGITDITFFLSKLVGSTNYEIRMIPFNEFIEEK